MRWLNGTTDLMNMSLSKIWELVMDWKAWHTACGLWGGKESDMTERLKYIYIYIHIYVYIYIYKMSSIDPVKVKVTQSFPALCNPIVYTVHGIL